jgi:hypothetical protein
MADNKISKEELQKKLEELAFEERNLKARQARGEALDISSALSNINPFASEEDKRKTRELAYKEALRNLSREQSKLREQGNIFVPKQRVEVDRQRKPIEVEEVSELARLPMHDPFKEPKPLDIPPTKLAQNPQRLKIDNLPPSQEAPPPINLDDRPENIRRDEYVNKAISEGMAPERAEQLFQNIQENLRSYRNK